MVVLVGSEIPRGISGAGRQGKYMGWEGQVRTFFRTILRDSLIPGVMQFVCVTKDPKNKVLITQSCLILCDPMGCSPPGSSVCGISQARILVAVVIQSLGHVRLFVTSWTTAHQAALPVLPHPPKFAQTHVH